MSDDREIVTALNRAAQRALRECPGLHPNMRAAVNAAACVYVIGPVSSARRIAARRMRGVETRCRALAAFPHAVGAIRALARGYVDVTRCDWRAALDSLAEFDREMSLLESAPPPFHVLTFGGAR
jgi:hypothetical protein